jgi:hypothetical protein
MKHIGCLNRLYTSTVADCIASVLCQTASTPGSGWRACFASSTINIGNTVLPDGNVQCY